MDLDRPTQGVTTYYDNTSNQSFRSLKTVSPGEIVVTKFSGDTSFYRIRVAEFKLDEYDETKSKVDLDLVVLETLRKKKLERFLRLEWTT